MPLKSFTAFTAAGAGIWTAVLAAAGFTIGRSSSDMSYPELVHRGSDLVQSHFLILLGGAAAISAAYIAVKWFRRRTTRS